MAGPAHSHAINHKALSILEKANYEAGAKKQHRFRTLAGVIIVTTEGTQRKILSGIQSLRRRFFDLEHTVPSTFDGAVPTGGHGGGRRSSSS